MVERLPIREPLLVDAPLPIVPLPTDELVPAFDAPVPPLLLVLAPLPMVEPLPVVAPLPMLEPLPGLDPVPPLLLVLGPLPMVAPLRGVEPEPVVDPLSVPGPAGLEPVPPLLLVPEELVCAVATNDAAINTAPARTETGRDINFIMTFQIKVGKTSSDYVDKQVEPAARQIT